MPVIDVTAPHLRLAPTRSRRGDAMRNHSVQSAIRQILDAQLPSFTVESAIASARAQSWHHTCNLFDRIEGHAVSDTEREDKTEDASPARVEQKRKEGEIPVGKDLSGAVALAFGLAALALAGPSVGHALVALVRQEASRVADFADIQAPISVGLSWMAPALGALVVVLAIALGGVAAGVSQTQGGIWPQRLAPDPKRLFQAERVTRWFKREMATDLALNFVKVVAVLGALFMAISDDFLTITKLGAASTSGHLATLTSALFRGAIAVFVVFAVVATLDFVLTRHRFLDKAKMTKEEVKREHKQDEGDPQVKGQRKRKHRALLSQGRIEKDVPTADAIVVNPTHIAIAIRYRKEDGTAPKVVCKGQGMRADKIRAMAREHRVPIIKDIPLARLLHKRVKVGSEVPAETYQAVAAVLTFVSKVTGRAPGTGR